MTKVNLTYVFQQMEAYQLSYFKIKDGKDILCVNENKISVNDAQQQIKDFLQNCETEFLSITISERSSKQIGEGGKDFKLFNYFVRVGEDRKAARGNTITASADTEKYLREIFQLKQEIAEIKFEQRIKELEEKGNDTGGIGAILNNPKYEPLISGLINSFLTPGKQPIALAGLPEDATHRLQTAINKLAAVDKGYLELIETVADLATEQTQTYFLYRSQLIKQ